MLGRNPGQIPKWLLSTSMCDGVDLVTLVVIGACVLVGMYAGVSVFTWVAIAVFLLSIEGMLLTPARVCERKARAPKSSVLE
jgi:hypothetical protein